MGKFTVTLPSGAKYNIEGADTPEEAHAAAAKQEYEEAPITSKARMAIGDPLQQITHGLTAGLFDKGFDVLTGARSAEDTQSAAERMGPTATTAARIGGAMMLPSGAPAATAAIGGGPLMRGIVGAGTAAAEQGAYGGVQAATQGDSIPVGILSGAVGGAVGQGVAQSVGAGVNKGAQAIYGSGAAPARNITSVKGLPAPTPRDYVDVAAAKAASLGAARGSAEATQQAQRGQFEKLLTGPQKKTFTPSQRTAMGDIAYGDYGTSAAEKFGDLLKNPWVAGAMGTAAGVGSRNPTTGLLAAGGVGSTGKLFTVDSAKATQEAVDRLRALMYGKIPYKGPLSAGARRKIGQGLGYEGMQGLEDYLQ